MNATPLNVWVVDDDAAVRWVLDKALKAAGMTTRTFERAEAFLRGARRISTRTSSSPTCACRAPDGLELMRRMESSGLSLPVIVITAHTDLDSAVAAYRGGAFEYLPKPFDVDEAVALVWRAARTASRAAGQRSGPGSSSFRR